MDVKLEVWKKMIYYLNSLAEMPRLPRAWPLEYRQYVNPNSHKILDFNLAHAALREVALEQIFVEADDMEDIKHHEYFTADSFLHWKRRLRLSFLRGDKSPLCEASTKPYDIRYPTSPCTWRII